MPASGTNIHPAVVASLIALAGVGVYSTKSFVPAWLLPGSFAVGWALSKAFGLALEKPLLNPSEYKEFPLVKKTKVSPNTAIYRFGLPKPTSVLGLPTGQHISIMVSVEGKEVARSYTPISADDDVGYFEVLIKTYPTGTVSKAVDELEIGQTIKVKGPKGNFIYRPNMVREFGMICGGTGIAPMLQVINAVLKNSKDKTKISLIFANVNESDILLREELDALVKKHPSQFSVYYVLNNPPAEWNGGVGFVSKEMIETHLPRPAQDIKILLCGPPPMIKAMTNHTNELGYEPPKTISKMEDMVFKF